MTVYKNVCKKNTTFNYLKGGDHPASRAAGVVHHPRHAVLVVAAIFPPALHPRRAARVSRQELPKVTSARGLV